MNAAKTEISKTNRTPTEANVPAAGKKIRLMIADDHTVVRQGLRALVEAGQDIEVVGEADNGRQAVSMAKSLQPDVVLMDLVMPSLNGLEATRQIIRECPKTRVLVLSSYNDDDRVQQLIEDGASGYLVKQTASSELLKGIREAHKGNSFFSASISKRLLDSCRESLATGRGMKRKQNRLTTREAEVLQLIAEGYANKQIADELKISIKTVEKHRQQVMNKLNIHEVASLTRYAAAQGIISSNSELREIGGGKVNNTPAE